MNRLILPAALAIAALAACNPYNPDLGPTPFTCGASEPRCPEGYSCVSGICSQAGDGVDGSTSAFSCADDGSVEGRPGDNDVIARAFVTPISDMPSYSLRGLAICPGADKDHFKIQIHQSGINFDASVTSMAGRTALSLNLLNSGGTLISSGAPVPGSPQRVELQVPNRLATGDYYVQVQSQDLTENNYDLTIKVCTTPLPCP
jgi:hypothetical protein